VSTAGIEPGWLDAVADVLALGGARGWVGSDSEAGIGHALGFARAVSAPRRFADLGSGGGLPGLVLACYWIEAHGLLIEANQRRAGFLAEAVRRLQLDSRVQVVGVRAEDAGRSASFRSRCDLVVARCFGPPSTTAECGAALLEVGGRLVVAEPPGPTPGRWPREGLGKLGLEPMIKVQIAEHGRHWSYRVLLQEHLCPERFPRRAGMPAKRPLF
jgi:16S rRNA (guanine527-N7)-methyltransferase